ncbi:MAG: GIY-YIG nuclease family protein [Candidatus Aenigmatarchaeota archaeon]
MYENIALEYVNKINEILATQSFSFKNVSHNQIPEKAGVYIIFNENNEAIYIGRTKNLRRRLLSNHRSGNIKGSQFRRALKEKHNFKNENEISNYIQKCTFKFKEIEDSIERIRLEHFATAILAPILNMKVKQ